MTGKKAGTKLAPRSMPELISLVVSIALVASVVGLVVASWLNPTKAPASFRIARGAIRYVGGEYYLPITITNDGDGTGAEVTVEGRVSGSGNEQVSATTFDFIPARSNVEGILIFDTEPTSVTLRVASYQQP
jgi:uncharacterized protein (TIGR02588 family)